MNPLEAAWALSARERCARYFGIVFERRTLIKVGTQSWDEVYACHFIVDVEGWRITLDNDCDEPYYWKDWICPDGSHLVIRLRAPQ
jgi:hypothetical protein